MKNIIVKYLDKNYRITLSTYVSYFLFDRIQKCEVRSLDILSSLESIFELDKLEIECIYVEWAEQKEIELNNRIVDIQTKIFIETGRAIRLSPVEVNTIIDEEEAYYERGI